MENQFRQYPLEEDILGALDALGYTQPTEIQAAVIPSILNGRDIIAKSKTGSGKTAAFAIPICNFADWEQNTAQALVLEPTRELAFQVKDELYAIGRFKRLKVPVLYGGFPMEKQILTLKQKTHIVVGTPGRVLDHCKRGTLDLSKVRYVVIDEADLMLDMGFIEDVRNILMHLEGKPMFMLFSATMGERLEALAAQFMHEPKLKLKMIQRQQIQLSRLDILLTRMRRSFLFFLIFLLWKIQTMPWFFAVQERWSRYYITV